MTDYPCTKDLSSYIPGYDSYCEDLKENQCSSEFSEEEDLQFDDRLIREEYMEDSIYKYMLQNCLGYSNRIKGHQLMEIFGIKDNEVLRSYIEKIRQDEQYVYLIGSQAGRDGGYFIPVTEAEKELSTNHIYLRAEEQLKTYDCMREKKIYEIEKSF